MEVSNLPSPSLPAFKRPTCRGCYALGTACGNCERCERERAGMAALGQSQQQKPAHQLRVVEERDELAGRLDRLTEFLKGNLFCTLSTDERRRLELQHHFMSGYLEVLCERIVHFQ